MNKQFMGLNNEENTKVNLGEFLLDLISSMKEENRKNQEEFIRILETDSLLDKVKQEAFQSLHKSAEVNDKPMYPYEERIKNARNNIGKIAFIIEHEGLKTNLLVKIRDIIEMTEQYVITYGKNDKVEYVDFDKVKVVEKQEIKEEKWEDQTLTVRSEEYGLMNFVIRENDIVSKFIRKDHFIVDRKEVWKEEILSLCQSDIKAIQKVYDKVDGLKNKEIIELLLNEIYIQDMSEENEQILKDITELESEWEKNNIKIDSKSDRNDEIIGSILINNKCK